MDESRIYSFHRQDYRKWINQDDQRADSTRALVVTSGKTGILNFLIARSDSTRSTKGSAFMEKKEAFQHSAAP